MMGCFWIIRKTARHHYLNRFQHIHSRLLTLFLRHSTENLADQSMLRLDGKDKSCSLAKGQKSPCPTHPQGLCHLLLCQCVTGMLILAVWSESCRRRESFLMKSVSWPILVSLKVILLCFVLPKIVWSASRCDVASCRRRVLFASCPVL